MMNFYGKNIKWLGIVILFSLMSCAGVQRPDIVSETPVNGTMSNAYVRRIVVDQPYLISGDYFLNRPTPKNVIDLNKFFKKSESLEARVAKLEKEVKQKDMSNSAHMRPEIQKRVIKQPVLPQMSNQLKTKMGVIFLGGGDYIKIKDRFTWFLSNFSQQKHFLFLRDSELRELLEPTRCLKKRNINCIVKNLSIYPGLRFLIVVDNIDVPLKFPGKVLFNINIIDTGLGYNYFFLKVSKTFKTRKEFDDYLKRLSMGVVKFAMEKKGMMCWFSHIFSIRGDKYYISAGRLSGINTGDVLKVVEYEKPIYAPTGVPVAWSPGKILGKLKVVRLIGRDVSECVKIEGNITSKVGNIVIK